MGVLILGKNFFLKLAMTNLKRDKKMYLPFLVAYSAIVSIYFMVILIMTTDGLKNVPGGSILQLMFAIGMVIMTILTIVFMIYINSFLIKRRKKEFGLYGVLGLEKRHVARVIVWENLIINGFALILGILSGCVFSKLIFLLIYHALNVSVDSRYMIPIEAFSYTIFLFFIIFIINSFFNLLQISLTNPIDLLKGNRIGEKKVRFLIPKTVIGIVLLVLAYYLASMVDNPRTALNLFFLAVFLVIFTTYLLFEAGSQVFLKFLKSRKKFYYKSNNFIAISSMFHRMKQNATGLASICILSTMVLVTVSTCTALFLGQEDMLKLLDPNDLEIVLKGDYSTNQQQGMDVMIQDTADQNQIEVQDLFHYQYLEDNWIIKDGNIIVPDSEMNVYDLPEEEITTYKDVYFITLKEFNEISGSNKNLSENEVFLLYGKDMNEEQLPSTIAKDYHVKEMISGSKLIEGKNSEKQSTIFIVGENYDTCLQLARYYNPNLGDDDKNVCIVVNMEGGRVNLASFMTTLLTKFSEVKGFSRTISLYNDRIEGFGIYGGLLFMGVFFTILFLVTTVLIIYFKQVSEGYDDKERFIILQKVGMDDIEVKRTISKQILMVFFLPLLLSFVHISFARHMLLNLLEMFRLYDTTLTTWCMIVTSLVFGAVYIIVYRLTARAYYKIVKW